MSIIKSVLVGAAAILMVGQVSLAANASHKHARHHTVASAKHHRHHKLAGAHRKHHHVAAKASHAKVLGHHGAHSSVHKA